MLEKTLESPLDSKEIKPVHPKGNQPWILTGRLMLKLQYLDHLMQRADSLEDSDAGKDWRQEFKDDRGRDGWMAWLTQWTWVWASSGSRWWTGRPGVLHEVAKSPWGHKESDTTERLNWTEFYIFKRKILPLSLYYLPIYLYIFIWKIVQKLFAC